MFELRLFGRPKLSFVSASQLNECGLACLACISDFFDGHFDLAEVRKLAAHSGRGETLLALRDLGERMGLTPRALRTDLNSLVAIRTPAILHWELNHFVVLEKVTKRGFTIMDPAAGRMHVTWAQADKAYTGYALELFPGSAWRVRSKRPQASVLQLLRPLSQWRNDVIGVTVLSVLLECLVLLLPMQMKLSVDAAVPASDGELALLLALGFGCVAILHTCISCVRAWVLSVLSARVGYELKNGFAVALHKKPFEFFLQYHSSEIFSRSKSVENLQTLISVQLIQTTVDVLMSLILVCFLVLIAPTLAGVVLAFTLIGVSGTVLLRSAAVDVARRSVRTLAKADGLFMENARAAKSIKVFGKEAARIGLWRNKQIELTNLALSDGRLTLYSSQLLQLTNSLCSVAVIGVGVHLVLSKTLTLGTLMMVLLLKSLLQERMTAAANYLAELKRLRPNAERVQEIVTQDYGAAPSLNAITNSERIEVEFRDVWFRYGDDSPWILNGVDLRITAGASVAITGRSGGGKTTLLQLAAGMLAPTKGEVLLNGRNVRTIEATELSRLIGVVAQDDLLFAGTVAENIGFFDYPIDINTVEEAARRANIAEEIAGLPAGYWATLAEGGANLSGGQRQRLFIARALYHRPKLLLLDEATSHLDVQNERLVSDAIGNLRVTRLLVAHRKETISTAEAVYELVDGRLIPQQEQSISSSITASD